MYHIHFKNFDFNFHPIRSGNSFVLSNDWLWLLSKNPIPWWKTQITSPNNTVEGIKNCRECQFNLGPIKINWLKGERKMQSEIWCRQLYCNGHRKNALLERKEAVTMNRRKTHHNFNSFVAAYADEDAHKNVCDDISVFMVTITATRFTITLRWLIMIYWQHCTWWVPFRWSQSCHIIITIWVVSLCVMETVLVKNSTSVLSTKKTLSHVTSTERSKVIVVNRCLRKKTEVKVDYRQKSVNKSGIEQTISKFKTTKLSSAIKNAIRRQQQTLS